MPYTQAAVRRYTPILPKPNSHVYHLRASAEDPEATIQLHPAPMKVEDSAFFRPGPDTIRVPPSECTVKEEVVPQANKTTQVTEQSLELPTGEALLEKIRSEVEKNLVQMQNMSKHNEELFSIFLCKREEERKREGGPPVCAAEEAERLKSMGILLTQPWSARDLSLSSTPRENITAQDPAIISTNHPVPSPSSSVPSSLPSLESYHSPRSDSDCVITKYIPPRKRNIVVKEEPSDSISQIAKGTEKLVAVIHCYAVCLYNRKMPQDYETLKIGLDFDEQSRTKVCSDSMQCSEKENLFIGLLRQNL